MKLYSNFKDYYDCAIGSFIESDVQIVRKQSTTFEYYKDMPDTKSFDGEYDVVKQLNYGTQFKFEQIHMIGFCGTWYFYVRLDDKFEYKYEIRYKTFEEIAQNNAKAGWLNKTEGFVNPNDCKYWKELFDKYGPVLYCEYRKPALYDSGKKKNQQVMQIDIWPELKRHNFIQVKEPYTALWELEHWYDSRAKPDEAIVPVGNDIVRLQTYGFDKKTSFRKAKEK